MNHQTPGTVQELEDGRRIVWGEMKITYSQEADKMVCHVAQEYKIIQEVWTTSIYEDPKPAAE